MLILHPQELATYLSYFMGCIALVWMQAESMKCFSLHPDTTPPQPNHTVTPTHIIPEQYNP